MEMNSAINPDTIAPSYDKRSRTFEMIMRVRDYEVDSQGIVNNSKYLNYFEHTRHEFCRIAGVSFASMQHNGIDPVVRRAEIDYIQPLRLGDVMRSTLCMEREGARFKFIQNIYLWPANTHVARGVITIVSLEHGRLTRGEALAEAFTDYL